MKPYLLIKNDDKGHAQLYWLEESELLEFLRDAAEWGVEYFFDHPSAEQPEYWSTGNALLLRAEIVVPKQQLAWVLPEDAGDIVRRARDEDIRRTRDKYDDLLPKDRLRAVWGTSTRNGEWLTGHGIVKVEDTPDIGTVSDSSLTRAD